MCLVLPSPAVVLHDKTCVDQSRNLYHAEILFVRPGSATASPMAHVSGAGAQRAIDSRSPLPTHPTIRRTRPWLLLFISSTLLSQVSVQHNFFRLQSFNVTYSVGFVHFVQQCLYCFSAKTVEEL